MGSPVHNKVLHLAHKPEHFGMAYLPEDDYLPVGPEPFPGFAYAFLDAENDGAGEVNHFETLLARKPVSGWRFAMGADKKSRGCSDGTYAIETFQGYQAFRLQAGEFGFVVYDGPEGIQPRPFREELFGSPDGADDSSAESGIGVNLDFHQPRMPKRPCIRP